MSTAAGVRPSSASVPVSRDVALPTARRRARWAARPARHGLARLHPMAALACIVALMAAGFVVVSPIALAMLLALIVAILATSHRLRAAVPYLRFSLTIAAVLIVLNPLFSRGGLDVLWHINLPLFDITITVQGLLFGLSSALRLCAVVWAFALYNAVLDQDDQLSLMSAVSFRSAMIVSLATRLFPVLSRDAARIADAQRARGVELDGGSRRHRVAARMPLLAALLTQSLERSVDLAESMDARGYGRRGRRAWKHGRRWRTADVTAAALATCVVIALVAGSALGAFRFRFFPLLDDPWSGIADPLWIVTLLLLISACVAAPHLERSSWRR